MNQFCVEVSLGQNEQELSQPELIRIGEMCKNENPIGFWYAFLSNWIWTVFFILGVNFTHMDFIKAF